MHPEIEKLIDLAIDDGQVTEKEREIILRKADSLGLDKDEIEMILEGKISEKTKKNQNVSSKQGVIKKCPHCGAPAKSFTDKCESCGEDFRFDTLNNLTNNLSGVEENDARQISLINIPLNKEELIQFATYSFGNAKNKALGLPERNAWYAKFNEAKNKLKLSYQIEFNPFKSDTNIAFIGGLMDKAQQLLLENELSGQDLKDEEDAKQLREDVKNQYKNPGWWAILILSILMCWGVYKLILHSIK
jgi:predicted DsbA family dithiol-disulfide isomerase